MASAIYELSILSIHAFFLLMETKSNEEKFFFPQKMELRKKSIEKNEWIFFRDDYFRCLTEVANIAVNSEE